MSVHCRTGSPSRWWREVRLPVLFRGTRSTQHILMLGIAGIAGGKICPGLAQ